MSGTLAVSRIGKAAGSTVAAVAFVVAVFAVTAVVVTGSGLADG